MQRAWAYDLPRAVKDKKGETPVASPLKNHGGLA